MEKIDVTVMVLTYNADFKKLLITLLSIMHQINIKVQIVISDDGSKIYEKDRIIRFFDNYAFREYVLLGVQGNRGTCKNYLYALGYAKGKYIKAISPGDCFADSNALSRWFLFMERNHIDVSFSKAIYYNVINNKINILARQHDYPIYNTLYLNKGKMYWKKVDWLVLFDNILGAAVLAKKEILFKYCTIISGTIRYTEDSMYRLMLLDEVDIRFISDDCIYYEYGSGISTSGSSVWRERLLADQIEFNKIVVNRHKASFFERKYSAYLKNIPRDVYSASGKKSNFLNQLLIFPESFILQFIRLIKLKQGRFKTSCSNSEYLETVLEEVTNASD